MVKPVVRVDDVQFQAWLSGEPEREAESLRLFRQEGALLTMEEMRSRVPIRNGFLRESIDWRETPSGFTVWPRASYAKYVNQGTGPHTIFPRQAEVLRFTLPSGGVVFARHVRHPGSVGQFFVRKTAEAVRERLVELFRDIWGRLHG